MRVQAAKGNIALSRLQTEGTDETVAPAKGCRHEKSELSFIELANGLFRHSLRAAKWLQTFRYIFWRNAIPERQRSGLTQKFHTSQVDSR